MSKYRDAAMIVIIWIAVKKYAVNFLKIDTGASLLVLHSYALENTNVLPFLYSTETCYF